MKDINLKVTGLTCASCAANIESKAKNIKDIENVSIDLMNNSVKLTINNSEDEERILSQLNTLADNIEPGSKILYKEEVIESRTLDNRLIRIISSSLLLLMGLSISTPFISFSFLILSYFIVGYDVIITAIKKIIRGQALDEHFLMSIATIGAVIIGERFEAVLVMLLYQIGEFLQDRAVNQSRKSISELMDIKPDFATLIVDNQEVAVKPESVKVGDKIIIRPGEKVALDGFVESGVSSVDAKALTGESLFKVVEEGSEVLSGSINIDGVIVVKVSKSYSQSTVSKILDLVENASSQKAESEKYITKFARYYTPIVVVIAAILAFIVPLVLKGSLIDYDYIYRSLTFLVISCPCALVISVPLSFFAGIGGASRHGILFKGGNYLEALSKVDSVIFDKTGTLTKGSFVVSKIISENDKKDVLEMAAAAEFYSNHPIAISITKAYKKAIDSSLISDVQELAHHGVSITYKDKKVLVGNYKLMKLNNIGVDEILNDKSIVYVAVDSKFYGALVIEDEIKQESYQVVKDLNSLGIHNIEMLSGDSKSIVNDVASKLGLSRAFGQLYPADKVNIVQQYLDENKSIAFVGDGINDAPVLTMATVGVAMGALGSDAAIEAADVVIMDDNPAKLALAIKHSQRTLKIVKQNITFALSVKFLFLVLGGFGISSMAMAVFADVGVSIIAILNSMRLLKVK
ncbi:MAG TPA: heavy metal translocating P-type ATPase [Erysipelotrichaceae bacterium]|nr:heavy metal translocating P-type ATPase [Erysipelotrichaceae bacterium]